MLFLTTFAIVAGTGIAAAAPSSEPATPAQSDPAQICKMVASDKPRSKPFELCLSKADWEAKAIADAKDANRMVCHYEDEPGTRLHNAKICMPASAWNARQQANREQVEGIQMKTCVPGAGC